MSRSDIEHLLEILQRPFEPCNCEQCQGKIDKIWCSNPIVDICLKMDRVFRDGLKNLIEGALFTVDMDETLLQNNLTLKES